MKLCGEGNVRVITMFFWDFPVRLVCCPAFPCTVVSLSVHSGFLIEFEKLVVSFEVLLC